MARLSYMLPHVARLSQVQPVDLKRLPQRTLDIKVRLEDEEGEGDAPRDDGHRRKQSAVMARRDKPKKRREPRVPPGAYLQPEDSVCASAAVRPVRVWAAKFSKLERRRILGGSGLPVPGVPLLTHAAGGVCQLICCQVAARASACLAPV